MVVLPALAATIVSMVIRSAATTIAFSHRSLIPPYGSLQLKEIPTIVLGVWGGQNRDGRKPTDSRVSIYLVVRCSGARFRLTARGWNCRSESTSFKKRSRMWAANPGISSNLKHGESEESTLA